MQSATELRAELADVFQRVKNGTMPIDQAETLANVAGKMIASALVQVKNNQVNKTHQEIAWLQEPDAALEYKSEVLHLEDDHLNTL